MYLQRAARGRPEHPDRRLRQRGRDRLPRVRPRPVQPARHHARRHPRAQRAAVGRRWARAGATGTRSTSPTTTAGSRHAGQRRRDRVPVLRRRRGRLPDLGGRLPGRRRRGELPRRGDRHAGRADTRMPTSARSSASPRSTPTARSGCRRCGRSASALGSAMTESLVTRGHGAVAAGAVVPGHAERDPAGRRGRVRRRRTRTRSGPCSRNAAWATSRRRPTAATCTRSRTSTCRRICAVDPCGTVSGTITDSVSGAPLQGVHVGIAGHMSGLGSDLGDVTNAAAARSPSPTSRSTRTASSSWIRPGYEQATVANFVVNGDETVDRAITRDWAALEGGATLGTFTPPDYTDFGCGPSGVFDLSLGTGWGSDAPGPRSVVVKLPPRAIDVTSFGFDPGNTCGDGPDAATKTFTIYTKTAGGGVGARLLRRQAQDRPAEHAGALGGQEQRQVREAACS